MPRGARKVTFSFDEHQITHFGGMWLIQRFCNKLALRHLRQRYVRPFQRGSEYAASELSLALLFAIIMGVRRINKTETLQYNGAFLEMLGLRRFPDQTTLRRFLKRLPPQAIRQVVRLHDSLRASLFALPRPRIRFRMDAGFYGSPVIRFLDGEGCGYAIVVREHPHLKALARGCRFHRLQNGWEVGSFQERLHHQMKRRHRFVVVRRPIPDDPTESAQLTFFQDRRYLYHVFVTNLPLSPWRVYRCYRPRAAIEKHMRELLYDYPLGKIPTETWTANVAFFQLLRFAANLVQWFKRLCLPAAYHTATLDTIRTDFLVLPARLARVHKQNRVKLPHDYHYQHEFLMAAKRIQQVRLPKSFRFCK